MFLKDFSMLANTGFLHGGSAKARGGR